MANRKHEILHRDLEIKNVCRETQFLSPILTPKDAELKCTLVSDACEHSGQDAYTLSLREGTTLIF